MNGKPKTCETCKHWVGPVRDASNLSAPPMADCRGQPPQALLLPNMQVMAAYPQTPSDFPACGMHQSKVQTPTPGAA